SAESLALRYAGLLQQGQRTATGTEEHELRAYQEIILGVEPVRHAKAPGAIGFLTEVLDLVAEPNVGPLFLEVMGELEGQVAEVDVSTLARVVCRDRLLRIAPLH